MKRKIRRGGLALPALAALALLPGLAAAAPPVPPGSPPAAGLPAALDVRFGWDEAFRFFEWQSLKVTVRSAGPALAGSLWVRRPGRRDIAVWDRRRVELSRGAAKEFFFCVRPEEGAKDEPVISVLLRDDEGRDLAAPWKKTLLWPDPQALNPVPAGGRPVARKDVFAALLSSNIRGFPASVPHHSEEKIPVPPTLSPSLLPDHPAGYASLDLLLWEDPDPEGLRRSQRTALREWVDAGGRLVLFQGSGRRSLPPAACSALLGRDDEAGPGEPASPPGIDWLTDVRSRLGSFLILMRDAKGHPFGAFDRSSQILREILRRPPRIRLLPLSGPPEPFYEAIYLGRRPPPGDFSMGMEETRAEDRAAIAFEVEEENRLGREVKATLAQMASLKPVPVRILVYFFGAYLLVVVPLDWWIARRARRFQRSWLLFPAAAVLFSLTAWKGTEALRGRQTHLAALTFFDFEPSGKAARETNFLCLVCPDRRAARFARAEPGLLDALSRPGAETLAARLPRLQAPRLVVGDGGAATADMEPWAPRFFWAQGRTTFETPPLSFRLDPATFELAVDNRLGFRLSVVLVADSERVRVYDAVPPGSWRRRPLHDFSPSNLFDREEVWYFSAANPEWPEATRFLARLVPDALGAEAMPRVAASRRRPYFARPGGERVLIAYGRGRDYRFRVGGDPQPQRNLWVVRAPEG